MKSQTEKKVRNLSLDDVVAAAKSEENVDKVAAWIKKIKDAKLFAEYPSWIEEYDIPMGTIAADCVPMIAWMNLGNYWKQNKGIIHPVHKLDELLTKNDVTLENGSMAYINEKNTPVIIPSVRGYFVEDKEQSGIIVASAHVSDMLSYHVRVDMKTKSANTIIPDPDTAKKRGMIFIDVTRLRLKVCPDIESQTKARDDIFKSMMENPATSLYLSTVICSRSPPTLIAVDDELTEIYPKLIKDSGSSQVPHPVLLPMSASYPIPEILLMDHMWKHLLGSRSIRGDDNGPGMITMSYIYGSMTKTMVKAMTMFLDLRRILEEYKTSILVVIGKIKPFVVRMLIRNGYYVVETANATAPVLTKSLYKQRKYGLYSGLQQGLQFGVYHEIISLPPVLKDGQLIYSPVKVVQTFDLGMKGYSHCAFRMLRAHMNPTMEQKVKYGIYPSALAHNAQVLCVLPPRTQYDIVELITRCSMANSVRDNWTFTKRPWCVVDPMRNDINYYGKIFMPKMDLKVKESFDITSYSTIDEENDSALADIVIPLGNKIKLIKPRRPLSPDMAIDYVGEDLIASNSIHDEVVKMMQSYRYEKTTATLRSCKDMGLDIDVIIDELKQRLPKHAKTIEEGRQTYRIMLQDELNSPPPPPPVPEEDVSEMGPTTAPRPTEMQLEDFNIDLSKVRSVARDDENYDD